MTDLLKALAIGCAVIIGIALVLHGNRPGPAPAPEPTHTSAPVTPRIGDLPDVPWPPPARPIRQPSVEEQIGEQIEDALAEHDRREHQQDRLLPGLRPIH